MTDGGERGPVHSGDQLESSLRAENVFPDRLQDDREGGLEGGGRVAGEEPQVSTRLRLPHQHRVTLSHCPAQRLPARPGPWRAVR